MLRAKNCLVRGCLMLVLAGCIILGAGTLFAIEHIRLARASNPRQSVLFNVGQGLAAPARSSRPPIRPFAAKWPITSS